MRARKNSATDLVGESNKIKGMRLLGFANPSLQIYTLRKRQVGASYLLRCSHGIPIFCASRHSAEGSCQTNPERSFRVRRRRTGYSSIRSPDFPRRARAPVRLEPNSFPFVNHSCSPGSRNNSSRRFRAQVSPICARPTRTVRFVHGSTL
jgi:hypothetical protein